MTKNIYLYGEIGYDITASYIREELENLDGIDSLTLYINSPGGSIIEGWAIINTLRRANLPITTVADSIVASMAASIFLLGKDRIMTQGTRFMIHPGMGGAFGNSEELRKQAEILEDYTEEMLSYYESRTGKSREEFMSFFESEDFMTPSEALELGFATEVQEPVFAKFHNHNMSKSEKGSTLDQIKALINSLKPQTSEPQGLIKTIEGGQQVNITTTETDLKEGDSIRLQDGGNLEPGSYTLANDGRKITVKNGQILSIEEGMSSEEIQNAELVAVLNDLGLSMKASLERINALESQAKEDEDSMKKLIKKHEAQKISLEEEIKTLKAQVTSTFDPEKPPLTASYKPGQLFDMQKKEIQSKTLK